MDKLLDNETTNQSMTVTYHPSGTEVIGGHARHMDGRARKDGM